MASYAPRFAVPPLDAGGSPRFGIPPWSGVLLPCSSTAQLHATPMANSAFRFGTPLAVSPKSVTHSYCSALNGGLLPHSSTASPHTYPICAHGCCQQALCFPPSPVLAGHSSNSRIVWEHTRGRYTCMQCHYSTASREEMTLHIEEHRKNPAPAGRMDTDVGMALGGGLWGIPGALFEWDSA